MRFHRLAWLNFPETSFTGGPLATFVVADSFVVTGDNGTATLTSGANGFHTPEPMSSVLLGSPSGDGLRFAPPAFLVRDFIFS